MGQIIKAFGSCGCDSFAKYVLNSAHCRSQCGQDCCVIEFETDEIDVDSPTHEAEVEVIGCCTARSA